MKKFLAATFAALLLAGCGENIEVPKMIDCDGCGKEISSTGEACANCSHPIADSVDAYVKAQEEEERRIKSYGGPEVFAKIKAAKESGATVLELRYNQISDVSPLKGLTKLKELSLTSNQITDITPLKGLTNLWELDLRFNPISEDQKAMLSKALPNCAILF